MSVFAAGAYSAVVLQLVAALDRYENDAGRMVGTWFDMDLYRTVSDEIDEIQRYSASLPFLPAAAAALLIAHSELVFALWRKDDPERVLAEHADRITALRRHCLRQLGTESR